MDRMVMQGSGELLSSHGCILSILTSCLPLYFRQDERDGQDADKAHQARTVPSVHPVFIHQNGIVTRRIPRFATEHSFAANSGRTATPPSW